MLSNILLTLTLNIDNVLKHYDKSLYKKTAKRKTRQFRHSAFHIIQNMVHHDMAECLFMIYMQAKTLQGSPDRVSSIGII